MRWSWRRQQPNVQPLQYEDQYEDLLAELRESGYSTDRLVEALRILVAVGMSPGQMKTLAVYFRAGQLEFEDRPDPRPYRIIVGEEFVTKVEALGLPVPETLQALGLLMACGMSRLQIEEIARLHSIGALQPVLELIVERNPTQIRRLLELANSLADAADQRRDDGDSDE